ncbi:MAG: hypothetical protein KAI29_06115 [Cyclobacteriaceae bacterium]|nr:hypothetical protein [Cyclobacteriaceae bacterium]
MRNQSIDSKLLFAQNAISNAQTNPEIIAALAVFGYDGARMKIGEALYAKTAKLQVKQVKEYGEQFAATDALNLAKATTNKIYMVHVKIARIALRGDRGAAESLQLSGRRKDTFLGWLKQAKALYTNALSTPAVLEALAEFGITKNKLSGAQAQVFDVEAKLNAQFKEKGEAQTATQLRDEAFDELQDWMSDFIAIARIALEDQSQYLEMLGIVEPS